MSVCRQIEAFRSACKVMEGLVGSSSISTTDQIRRHGGAVNLDCWAVDPRIRLVLAVDQADAAYARNVGAAAAKAGRLAFIDDDDIVGLGWLAAIDRALDDHPLVAPKIDYTLLNASKVTDGWPLTQATGLRTLRGYVVSTGHVGITAALWARLGGQRTGFLAGEDMELSLRAARELGIPPVYVPTAVSTPPSARPPDHAREDASEQGRRESGAAAVSSGGGCARRRRTACLPGRDSLCCCRFLLVAGQSRAAPLRSVWRGCTWSG